MSGWTKWMRWYVSVEVREWPLPAGPTVRQAQENSCRRHRDLIHGFFTPSYSVPLPTFPLLSPRHFVDQFVVTKISRIQNFRLWTNLRVLSTHPWIATNILIPLQCSSSGHGSVSYYFNYHFLIRLNLPIVSAVIQQSRPLGISLPWIG